MKTQKLPFWLLAIAMIFTILLSSCTKETINEIEQTESNLSAYSKYDVEALKDMINKDLLLVKERIEKVKKLRESVTKQKSINLSLSASLGSTIYVPDDFPTIQEAVDAAADGSLIIIDGAKGEIISGIAGSFYGCDIVDRNDLTIRGINNATVVTRSSLGYAFLVEESYGVTIERLTNRGVHGVVSINSADLTIANNIFSDVYHAGIILIESTGGNITKNKVLGARYGIITDNCTGTFLEGNTLESNWNIGLFVIESTDLEINNNEIKKTDFNGAVFWLSNNNYISRLEVSQCGFAPYDPLDYAGVLLFGSSYNSFLDVESNKNSNGLALVAVGGLPGGGYCRDNYFAGLETKDNEIYGIDLVGVLGAEVESTQFQSSESKSNGVCDLQDFGINTILIDTEIGSTCN